MNYLSLIQIFAPHFSKWVWEQAQVLLIGAMLVPGRRTVTAVLRIMGLSAEPDLSSRAQSRGLVELGVEPDVAPSFSRDVCAQRASDLRFGRYD